MLKAVFDYIEQANTKGLHFPFLFDPTTSKPSVTLLFMYISFLMAVVSITASHFYDKMIPATMLTIAFWVLSVVFYRLRKLDELNLNLKTGAVEIKDDEKKGANE